MAFDPRNGRLLIWFVLSLDTQTLWDLNAAPPTQGLRYDGRGDMISVPLFSSLLESAASPFLSLEIGFT